MTEQYSLPDIKNAYFWLGHEGRGYTELNAYHPDYQPGPEHYERNRKYDLFPKVAYTGGYHGLERFVDQYAGQRTIAYGVNPRPKILRNPQGYVRGARDQDIEIAQNMFLDIDYEQKDPAQRPKEYNQAVGYFLHHSDEFFQDKALRAPVKAFTGNGHHLLLPYPPVSLSQVPDWSQRQRKLRDEFVAEYSQELGRLELKVDPTQDISRKAKVYGTAKPGGVLSRFLGGERESDQALCDYLLSLEIGDSSRAGLESFQVHGRLPGWFPRLLDNDPKMKMLWLGRGKPDGTDQSRSGFDYSILKRLVWLGKKDPDDLATILALRPEGAVRQSGKGQSYLERTVKAVL